MNGPGRYDDVCTMVRMVTGAKVALVIVIDGDKGEGFSLQLQTTDTMLLVELPALLRKMADTIAADLKVKAN